jgi:EAL domain-containing protein (putative c-di-GMP-specific phosphodiesterase class I)
MRFLLIDDEAFALNLLGRQLANLGFDDVKCYERAYDALADVERDIAAIGVLFCDLQMEEMDGIEVVRRLAGIGYGGGLVLVSGEDQRILQTAEKLARAHKLNVLGILHKPVAPDELRRVLYGRPSAVVAPAAPLKVYQPDELRRALAEHELVNYYQPKVSIGSGTIAGVEALVRWRHPSDGLALPVQFVPMAEEHGLIDDLALEVLTSALRQSRRWRDAGIALQVAVNVSMDNLAALDFPDFVANAARDARVPSSSLVLEVTESRLMKDALAPLDILARLRLKHIGLSIDDFGTGHSSLAQLRDIPFDELKIDRGFVRGASRDSSLGAIVEASIGMARQLAMRTVAEGVEDREDWDFLRNAGCDFAQGYFIARPMPGAELEGWLRAWEVRRADITQFAA